MQGLIELSFLKGLRFVDLKVQRILNSDAGALGFQFLRDPVDMRPQARGDYYCALGF